MSKTVERENVINEKGFTLVETIIYVALIGMVVSTFVSFGLKVTEIRNKNYVVEEVQANARSVMDYLSESIRSAEDILLPTFGNTEDSIELDLANESDNLILSVVNGSLNSKLGLNPVEFINSKETSISNLDFINLGSSGERASIKIEFTIEYRGGDSHDFTYSQSLETTVSLRL